MNPDQLWRTTMNPETRTLVRVNSEDTVEADASSPSSWVNRVEPRRQFIEENAGGEEPGHLMHKTIRTTVLSAAFAALFAAVPAGAVRWMPTDLTLDAGATFATTGDPNRGGPRSAPRRSGP